MINYCLHFGVNFNDGVSFNMVEALLFHDFGMVVVIFVCSFVGVMLGGLFYFSGFYKTPGHNNFMENVWTFLPLVILVVISIPSLGLLYFVDTSNEYGSTSLIKVVGHQWFWEYELEDFSSQLINFNAYLVSDDSLCLGEFRNLEVDLPIFSTLNNPIQFLVTSYDVLHSFALPSVGVKVDAVPGRLNQQTVVPFTSGVYYGQCSEICGVNHSFMPICLEVI